LYFEWIEKVLDEGRQVLFIMSEIDLTSQMVQRLRRHFGDLVGVYHSKFNEQERVEIWNKVLDGTYRLVIGARSALFLPHQKLGLIIVDEEHDQSYKQFDPAPRYQGRDAAIMLAHQQKAKVILGSATPSVETVQNTKEGKYGLVHLTERYGGKELPEVHTIDLSYMIRTNRMRDQYSIPLIEAMQKTIDSGLQVILFQNRRGYSPYLVCGTCGWIPYCKQCDVRLTFHKFRNRLVCHYCGYHEQVIEKCKACGSVEMHIRGSGTQKLEDDLQKYFPLAKIERMDWDSARNKHAHEEIIERFERKEVDILVGTQMVTKGLDFDHVGLVGIVQADQLWSMPDFRANERAFQLIQQVSGRAGRKHGKGEVYVQTYQPEYWVLKLAQTHNLKGFYHQELQNRKEFGYPPFRRLIHVTLKHKEVQKVETAAYFMAGQMRKAFPHNVLGPTVPGISRIKNQYLRDILLKSTPDGTHRQQLKGKLIEVMEKMGAHKEFKSVQVHLNVDP
jgi:primosomal protein N' (replication factor Y)